MSSAQTLPVPHTHYLETRFEPCGAFVDGGDADPICADCGWLHGEHREQSDRSPTGTPR